MTFKGAKSVVSLVAVLAVCRYLIEAIPEWMEERFISLSHTIDRLVSSAGSPNISLNAR